MELCRPAGLHRNQLTQFKASGVLVRVTDLFTRQKYNAISVPFISLPFLVSSFPLVLCVWH